MLPKSGVHNIYIKNNYSQVKVNYFHCEYNNESLIDL